jgi:hypothetical protein
MATIPLPKITYRPALPADLIARGGVSAVQLEGISIVGQQNAILLPNGARASALIGDGTGVGKGRESAGILYDNYKQGRKRLVWVSEKWDLMQAAIADFDGMGATELMRGLTKQGNKYIAGKNAAVIGLDNSKFKDPTTKIEHDGVLFTTYALIRSGDKKGNKRVHQLERYLRGDDDGEGAYILFDESHNLKNAVPGDSGGRGRATPSQIGMAVKELLERMPKLRTASLSATAATDVSNLGYLDRLGLWGAGTAFPGGFREFQAKVAPGGLAAMELIARELKAQGKYISRTLSFKGVTYGEAEHKLNDDQKAIYRTAAKAWATVIERAEKTITETTNGGSVARRNFMSQLGGAQQRFYSLLISVLKIPTAVELANKALARGEAVVISLVNTNEAAQNREMNKAKARSDEEEEQVPQDYDFGPKEMLKNLVETHYPIQQYADDVDTSGRPIKVPVFREGPDGEKIPVINPQAKAERDALLKEIHDNLHMPQNPLDELVQAMGGRNKVAELTGRKKIYDRDTDKFIPRGDPNVPQEQYNLVEMAKFQAGEKLVAVISGAAGTGISLHASNQAKNQRKRFMITLQVGWSADKAQQMLGRVHRTDQAHPPEYCLLVSDLGGEKRFIATIARRLGSLGALTKGQKNATGGSDLMSKVNFESDQGRQASRSFYLGMLQDQPIPGTGLTGMEILSQMRMLVTDPQSGRRTVPEEDQTNVTRLLNRMLNLDPDIQNGAYNYYYDIFLAAVEDAIARGSLDTGVRTLPGDEVTLKPARTISTDPKTGATTQYQPLTSKIRMERVSPKELTNRLKQYAAGDARIIVSEKGDKLALLQNAAPIVHADGSAEAAVYMSSPGRGRWQKIPENTLRGWKPVDQYSKEKKTKAEGEVSSARGNLQYWERELEREIERERSRLVTAAVQKQNRAEIAAQQWDHEPSYKARFLEEAEKARKETEEAKKYDAPDSYNRARIETARESLERAEKAMEPFKDLFEDPQEWAENRWAELYEASPTHETKEHHFITGAVMKFWNPISESAHLRNSIFTATDSKTGKRVVGIDIPDGSINKLLARIEGGKSTVNAAQLEIDVLRNGTTYELETGVQVRRNRVGRDPVIQMIPQTQDVANHLVNLGLVYEKGVTRLYYVPTKNTSAILTRILERYPVKTEPADTPPSGGGRNDVYMGFGLGALQSVFDRGGLTPQLKKVSRFFSQVADDTKRVFAPQTRGTGARIAAGSFREMMGTLAQKEAQVHAALNDYKELFYKLPEEHGIHGLNVIDAIEAGPQAINQLPADLRPFATTVRGLYEDRKNLLDGLGLVKHFLENYFTHMYKNPTEAEAWTANWLSKRPLAGKEQFRKERVYPTLREALEDPDFTLVAKFDNPVDYVYAGLAQMDKSIAAHDLFNEWQDAGYLKYGLKRPDGGYSQIDDKLFSVRGPRRGAVKIDPEEPTIRPNEDPDDFDARHQAWEDKMQALDEGYIKPGDVRVFGQRTMGHYWAPDQMAQVANNYLSPGLHGKAFYDAWMKTKNGMNAINLGFSAFHALTTTLNSALSDMALGFEHLAAGRPVRAAASVGKGFTPFASIVQDYLRGTRLGQVWDGTAANPTAQELAIVDALRQAGGRYKQGGEAAPLLAGLKKSWAENKKALAILKGFNPWLWAEQTMRPIMEKLVPAARLGAFAKMVQFDIEHNPGMDINESREKFGAALDSIDNRMGQLIQNNMLMNNTVRAWMNAIVGRPGWTLGTIREIVGGAGFDFAQNLYDLSHGKPTRLSHRTAYVLAMLLGGAMMNGVLNFLLSGDLPHGNDFLAPRDGGVTEDGHESRLQIPLYLNKDIYSWATHPLRTLKAKMAQPLMVTSDLATNRDFYQRKIYGRGGIGLDNYLLHLFFPYVLSGALQNRERGQGWGKTLLPFVGVMPAGRDVGLSKAEKILSEYRQEQMANTRPAPTDHSRARSKMMMAAERGDADTVRELGMDGIEKGILSKRDVDAALKRIDMPLIVSEVQSVSDMEVLMNAWDAATPKERDMIEDAVRAKIARARLDPYKWTPRARKLAEKYFDVEIPTGPGAEQAEDLGTPDSLEGVA